ncbi:RTA1 like protein-domain-containing protein [Amylocarpus encephaloides]|uniref:RTA1 like protein-domain-containing protein n=1 Tax=Amylocarpus encephaloides TaxID=45428 RepID=A0A9P8C030_9HELO|nr:RTA1 like protein-domain-containing protein [Amylocarpus encephaloides]
MSFLVEAVSSILEARATQPGRYRNCTLETCPISASVYGYLPNKAANYFFLVCFAISCLAHFFQGAKSRSWTFMIAFGIGAFGETVGYVGRILLRKNPFSREYLTIMLVPGTVAPAFLAGGIYLTLKHIIIIYGRKFSRIAPRLYTWIFVFADIASIVIQSLGAVVASRGTNVKRGNDIMMVGLSSQVATLIIFGIMALDVFLKIRSYRGQWNASTLALRHTKRFKGLLIAIVIAYTTITIRCIYRIAEMAGGWRNPIMQDEPAFIVLDSVMCLVACLAMNVFHPGFLFKQSYATIKAEKNGHVEEMSEQS